MISKDDILNTIAEQSGTAIKHVRSKALLTTRVHQDPLKITKMDQQLKQDINKKQLAVNPHQTLFNISELTANAQLIEQFYVDLHHEVKKLLPAHNFYIGLLSDDLQQLEFPYYNVEKFTIPQTLQLSNSLSNLVISSAKPALLTGNTLYHLIAQGKVTQSSYILNSVETELPRAWLAAPLLEQNKSFGFIAMQDYQDENAYQSNDLELINFISQHIAIAISRHRMQQEMQHSHLELESIIDKRTKELQQTNKNLHMQIAERSKAEARLYHDAHHDALTQLPNRAMFSERVSYAIKHLKRHPNQRFAVLFIDLDRFKMINDTLGHHIGDQLLIEIANRLSKCIRDNDLLARLGGDEFVILLDSLQSSEAIEEIASRMINSIEKPFEIDGHTLYSNASIGIAQSRISYKSSHEIISDADAAMYQAKSLGTGRYIFFDDSMREQLIASMTLEQELRQAIKNQEFELHYQKISNLASTTTLGFEVLLRWQHPTRGLLTPSEFLYMAEETGMILEIETWVIEEVCLQLILWKQSSEYHNVYIAINLSGRHLTQANQLQKLMSLISSNTIEPERIILEFNESAFAHHTELALKGLRKLKQFGVKLALDDYGSGLSSFNFLHNYPFEFIKLDRSFVRTLNHNEKNFSLVKALHELGMNFGYHLVAEGIESEEILQKLQTTGCKFGQGYHISRPGKLIIEKSKIKLIDKYRA